MALFSEGVPYIGKAQEKAAVFRTIHKRNAETGKSYPWISRGSALPNYYYFYLLDKDSHQHPKVSTYQHRKVSS
ncbi:MAG TPA: hypothetical protein VLS45_00355 [Methylomicrobium sp.]|nr:hypothetical protein [Methylomicrobium sp.]